MALIQYQTVAPIQGDGEIILLRKWLQKIGGSPSATDTAPEGLAKILRSYGGSPKPGDSENRLLAGILRSLGGTPHPADGGNNLLAKILIQLGGSPSPSDNRVNLLVKILGLAEPPAPPISPAVLDFITRASISDETQIAAVQALYTSAVVNGWWDKCDIIYPFVGGTALAHSQNLKSSSFTITWVNTVTHNANGITGDGVTGCGDTGYIPGTSGMSLNSCSFTTYLRTHPVPATGKNALGSRSLLGATRAINLGFFNTATVIELHGQISLIGDLTSVGLIGGARYSATNVRYLVNGTVTDSALAVTGLSDCSLSVLAQHNCAVDTQSSPSDVNLASLTYGIALESADLANMNTDWQAFQTALGRQV